MQAVGDDAYSVTRTRAAAWLVDSQRPDGGWPLSGDHHEANQAFPTALALQALYALDGSEARHRGCDAESRGSSNTNAVTEAGRRSR